MAFEHQFIAYRHANWGGADSQDYLVCVGEDLSLATFTWVFSFGEGRPAAIRLENAAAGVQGISAIYDDGLLDPHSGAAVGGTYLIPQIDASAMEALPDSFGKSAEIVLNHTLYVTPHDAPKRVECFGKLIIKQGVPD